MSRFRINTLRPPHPFLYASSGYFRTLGIPLLAGRDFSDTDRDAVIVNQVFANRYFKGDALGRDFIYGGGRRVTIVGVAGSTNYRRLREEPKPLMIVHASGRGSLYLQVRTHGDPAGVIEQLKALVRATGPGVPIERITTMEMQIDDALARERLLPFLSTLMAIIALMLATLGLYGVMAFTVVSRTREVGIRLAIGAERSRILGHFMRQALGVMAIGVAAGVALALVASTLAESLLYGLHPRDPLTAIGATLVLSAAAALAAVIPAWRASRLDPLRALRWE